MKISEIDKIYNSYAACNFEHCCGICPMADVADYGKCSDILDHRVMDALERLKSLELRLHTAGYSTVEPDNVFRDFIIKDEENNNEIRLHNALVRNGINTVAQFAEVDPKVIMRIRNVGPKLIAIAEERYKEARELLGLEPISFDPLDIKFILKMKPMPEWVKKDNGYYD